MIRHNTDSHVPDWVNQTQVRVKANRGNDEDDGKIRNNKDWMTISLLWEELISFGFVS